MRGDALRNDAEMMILMGFVMIAIGSTYSLGVLGRMGPGSFPVGVGILLALTGAAIMIAARLQRVPAPAVRRDSPPDEWRGWSCIVGGLLAFIVLGSYWGFVPAIAAIVGISAMGERADKRRDAALRSRAMVAALALVSWCALKMTFPLYG